MKNSILITGASGFIGSFLVEEALHKGYTVFAGVRKTSSKAFLKDPAIRFLEMDFSSPAVLSKQVQAHVASSGLFDYVIHNAGATGTKGEKEFEKVNHQYTRNLVDVLISAGMPGGKFIFVSSLAAVGPGDPNSFEPIGPGRHERPVSRYGRSKLKAEEYIRSRDGFPYLIVRPTAVFGPRDRDFLSLVSLINRGLEPSVGGRRQMISMIYVKDLARVLIALLETSRTGETLIASDGLAYDKKQLGTTISKIMNKKTIRFSIPENALRYFVAASEKIQGLVGRHPFLSLEKLDEINQPNWLCDSSLLWTGLPFGPAYTLEAGLRETIGWYRETGWLKG